MKWTETLAMVGKTALNTMVDTLANTFNVLGSVACSLGGVGYALSGAMNDSVDIAYFGRVKGHGNIDINIGVHDLGFNQNQTIPMKLDQYQRWGGANYALEDYVQPKTVETISVLCVVSGTLLRTVGDTLKYWHLNNTTTAFYKQAMQHTIPVPSWKEYGYIAAESFLGSVSYASLGYGITSIVMNTTGFIGSQYSITYPKKGPHLTNRTLYSGEVQSALFDFYYKYTKNITVEVPIIHNKITVEERLNASGIVDATYGVGFFAKSHDSAKPLITVPITLGISTALCASFFHHKVDTSRTKRALEATALNSDIPPEKQPLLWV